jgi:WD40 repeat protein
LSPRSFHDEEVMNSTILSDHNRSKRVVLMAPHTQAISSMLFLPAYQGKLITCSYDGSIRLMNIEKQIFEELFIHPTEASFCSLCACHTNGHVVYYSSKDGSVGRLDLREHTSSSSLYSLHRKRVNTIDMHPLRETWLLTGSGDRTACLWDIRHMKASGSIEPLTRLEHGGSTSSAYFSPTTGSTIVTCSMDNALRVFDTMIMTGGHLDDPPSMKEHRIPHNNATGRWTTPFKAIFDPKYEDLFMVGNKKRAIDVFSARHARYAVILQHEFLSTIPAVNCIHPYHHIWLSGNASGRVHVWRVDESSSSGAFKEEEIG